MSFVQARLRKHHQKLLTAPAAHLIDRSKVLAREIGKPSQYGVARGVAVTVVDLLEMIQIDQGNAPLRAVSL